jgi:hypothetical protein
MPVAWVPGEVGNEANFENTVEGRFLTWGRKVFGQTKCCPMPFLGEDFDWRITLQWNGDVLAVGGLDAAGRGGPAELFGAGCVLRRLGDLVDPLKRGVCVGLPPAYPIARLGSAVESGWVPGNAGGDNVFALPIRGMEVHSKGGETFPVLSF